MLLFHVFHRLCAGLFGEARLAGVRRLQFDPQVPGDTARICVRQVQVFTSSMAPFSGFHFPLPI